jgi:hypothetical protein
VYHVSVVSVRRQNEFFFDSLPVFDKLAVTALSRRVGRYRFKIIVLFISVLEFASCICNGQL